MSRAHNYTGWFQAHLNSVVTEIALIGGIGLWVDVNRIVWASIHAALTTNAVAVVKIHHTIGCSK